MQLKSSKIIDKINLANKLYEEKKYNKVAKIYKDILPKIQDKYNIDKSEIYRRLGYTYHHLEYTDKAIKAFENSIKYFDKNPSVFYMLGYLYFYIDADKQIYYDLKGMELEPRLDKFVMLTQRITKNANYSQKDVKEIFEKYVDYFRPSFLEKHKQFEHTVKDKNKKLNIAYLSSDFYCHAMMQFILPILENHNQEKFNITIYGCNKNQDFVTQRIKATGLKYEDCSDLDYVQLAEKIYNDKIDILIDLGGYTHDKIWSLIYKPAPIQVQFLGFLGTYGMKEVDYIIADKFTINEQEKDYYTETPMYMDCGMNRFTFNTKDQVLPEITELPCLKNNFVTFGSFNTLDKINPTTVKLWANVLKAVENSKLLIYRTQLEEKDIKRFKKQFEENGINEDRLIFDNTVDKTSHFNSYLKCDIALDPIPFTGLTVTIEMLHMGIPIMSLNCFDTIASKGTSRVNKMLKLDNLVATNEEDFVKKAKILANNIDMLKLYRNHLRPFLLHSYLCNAFKDYVECLEENYIKVWYKYCDE